MPGNLTWLKLPHAPSLSRCYCFVPACHCYPVSDLCPCLSLCSCRVTSNPCNGSCPTTRQAFRHGVGSTPITTRLWHLILSPWPPSMWNSTKVNTCCDCDCGLWLFMNVIICECDCGLWLAIRHPIPPIWAVVGLFACSLVQVVATQLPFADDINRFASHSLLPWCQGH